VFPLFLNATFLILCISFSNLFCAPLIQTAAEVQKLGHKTQIFEMPSFGESHWFMPLKYHGDGEVIQHGPKPSSK
jgi:hypothetical protein